MQWWGEALCFVGHAPLVPSSEVESSSVWGFHCPIGQARPQAPDKVLVGDAELQAPIPPLRRRDLHEARGSMSKIERA